MKFIKTIWKDYKRLSNADGRWVAICTLIYISFLLLDIYNPEAISSGILKYIGIFLCVVYAFSKHHRDAPLTMALLFTLLSDTFLVWTKQEFLGVLCFCIAQYIHLYRFKNSNQKYFGISLILAFLSLLAFYHGMKEVLYIASLIYAILLLCNLTLSAKNYFKPRSTIHDRWGFYGFCLFVACDICVATRHLILDGVIADTTLPLINFLIWFFYYPAQVFIASSSNIKSTANNKAKKQTKEPVIQ